jgi:hypothetical protein
LLLLYEFRDYTAFAFLVSIFGYYLNKKMHLFQNFKASFLIFIVLLFFTYQFLIDFTIFEFSIREALNYRNINMEMYYGGSQMWINFPENNFLLFFMNYLHSFFGNLIGPLPWQINSLFTSISFFIESIPMIFILLYIFKNRGIISDLQRFILFHSMVWIFFIAFTNDNIGTATRLRPVSWTLIIIVFLSIRSIKAKEISKDKINRG